MKPYWQINRYNHVAVETADQKELILICYDEAIRSLQQGMECFQQKRFEEKARLFIRAQDFITELLVSLNMEAGGQISSNLKKIYQFVIDNILVADIKRDMKLLSDLIRLLSELRSAWAQMDSRPSATNAYGQPQLQNFNAARGIAV
jgi:flagellar secretion chaperone FliS